MSFEFCDTSLSKIHPFGILVDASLKILWMGKTFVKFNDNPSCGDSVSKAIKARDFELTDSAESLLNFCADNLVITECQKSGMVFKSQFFKISDENFFFAQSPVISSKEEIKKYGLKFSDFCLTDPLIDLLLLIKTQSTTLAEQEKLNEELSVAISKANAANESKSLFLANMSHEIRTPLNSVIGMTSMLKQTSLSEEQEQYVSRIRKSGDALLSVITDILDFSKIEAGQESLSLDYFRIDSIVDDCIDVFSDSALGKGIELYSSVQTSPGRQYFIDDGKIRQILINFIGNAIKFTENGYIEINVFEKSDSTLRIEVEDTGIGIKKSSLTTLFEAFEQGDLSSTKKYGGTGLGLTICKRFIELMGGKIGVESKLEKGSTFFIEFACKSRDLVVDTDEAKRPAQVVYISSHSKFSENISHYSNRSSLECVEYDAQNEQDPNSVLFVDIRDVETEYKTFLNNLERNFEKLVLISGPFKKYRHLEKFFRDNGCDKVIRRPLKNEEWETCIDLNSNSDSCALRASENYRFSPDTRILVAEDNMANQEVVKAMLETLDLSVDIAGDGSQAVSMLTQGNYDLVLMDCQMPVMDGYTATQKIRSRDNGGKIPIIALTANALSDDRKKCLDAGMDDFISKPVKLETLSSALRKWLDPHKADEQETGLQNEDSDSAEEAPKNANEKVWINKSALESLKLLESPKRPDFTKKAINSFIDSCFEELSSISKEVEALNAASVKTTAHKFKTSCGIVGAQVAFELCAKIEESALAEDMEKVRELFEELEEALEASVATLKTIEL